MIYRISIGMILLLVSIGCSATAQSSDIILIEGKELRLNTNPLKKYLKESDWKPPEVAAIWSSNWRGYIANWKIEAGHLILIDVSIELKNDASLERKRKSILTSLFPSTKSIKANWYSGALIIPDGEMINYVHMGYGSTFDAYQILRIRKGAVIEHLKMSQKEFESHKNRKFEDFKKSDEFKNELKKLVGDEYGWSEKEAIDFMQSYYAERYLSQ